MVKPVAKAEISSFIKGIITEASPLNFPGDATQDEENFKLNRDGTRDRRLGMDFEDGYSILSTDLLPSQISTAGISSFKWDSAAGNSDNEFIVVQFGSKLKIFDGAKGSLTSDGFLGTVTLPGVSGLNEFSYASVDGILVVAAGVEEIYFVEWTGSSFTVNTDRLLVRDLWGLPGNDGNNINLRPTTLTSAHTYNLRNQGWGVPRKNASGTLSDPINIFAAHYSKYPANSESVVSALQYEAGASPYERVFPAMYDDVLGLQSIPSKGYFIIDALRRGTSRLSAMTSNASKFSQLTYPVASLPQDTTQGGCSVIAEYAGRVFYAGFGGQVTDGDTNSPVMSSYILFSQLVRNSSDIVKCYQDGDPTSREGSDVVDTDGGFIRVSGAKKIVGIFPLNNMLIVLADNGVWSLAGGSDYGFTATNYSVTKISSYGCLSNKSVVIENDKVFYWGDSGIFAIYKDQFGDLKVDSISETTIQSLFDDISTADKQNAKGIYDPLDKKVKWIYNIDSNRENSNTVLELVFDTSLGAFYKNRIMSTGVGSPDIISLTRTSSFLSGISSSSIVVNGESVEVNGEEVVVDVTTRSSNLQSVKYIAIYGDVAGAVGFTFSQYKDLNFRDWLSSDGVGVDAKGYMLTGAATAGDSSIYKQTPYLVMHFRRTEVGVAEENGELVPANQSSCLCRSQWDWANTSASNKWGPLFQAYRYRRPFMIGSEFDSFDTGFETVVSKSKLRGRGRAFSLYMETEPYKDCRIVGWSLSITGNNLA